ncbi:hypothetical protein MKW94_030440 [Papaver nudicaule]|uniref:Uncharacterized protein n=1 Tax=Papaver nudicaule TaxID=74823 RepID=A0AA41S9H9_PAPNU|nr:hypothetical protein [Papaver nudicaule]
MCSNIIALYKSAGGVSELEESAEELMERCDNACFQLCNKKLDTTVVAK